MSCLTILSSACTLSAPHQRGKTLKSRFASLSLAPPRFVPLRFAHPRFAPLRSCPSEVCLTEICPTKVGLSEVCPSEGCLSEVCFSEVCSSKVGLTEVCASEVCLSEVCPFKVRLAEVCPSEVCSFSPFVVQPKRMLCSKSFRDQFCSSWILLFDPIHLVRLAQALILMRATSPPQARHPAPSIPLSMCSGFPDARTILSKVTMAATSSGSNLHMAPRGNTLRTEVSIPEFCNQIKIVFGTSMVLFRWGNLLSN